jgi:hypothetical protein
VTAEFRRRFEAEKEIINCRELTEADLITPKGVEQCMRSDVPQTICFPIVATRPGTRYETPSVRGMESRGDTGLLRQLRVAQLLGRSTAVASSCPLRVACELPPRLVPGIRPDREPHRSPSRDSLHCLLCIPVRLPSDPQVPPSMTD